MFRKMLPLFVVGIIVLSGLGAVAQSSEKFEQKILTISFTQPIVEKEKDYVSINMDEANSFIMKQGKPMLPSYVHTFTFPFGTKIKSVACTPKNIQTLSILKDIKPTPKAVIVGQTVTLNQEEPVNYGTEIYPANWFEYDISCGRYDGELKIVVKTEVCPIKYHPIEKTIEWTKEVDILIEFEESIKQPTFREQYELIVIAPNEFSDELAPLISHKNSRGVSAKFVGLNEVYSGTGRDNQEKIKYYIKDAIENWATSNVLIVGAWVKTNSNYHKFPARETNVESIDPPDDEDFVSDLYYADIYDGDMNFCSWDADGDSKFGEYYDEDNIDEVDGLPDVYFGRIPARNEGEVTTIVNKIKKYENDEPWQEDWFTNLIVLGGDTSPDYSTVEGEYINQKVINMMAGFTPEKLWVTNGKLTQPLKGVTNIKNAINDGCGFVDFSGHGNTNVWATHPEESHTWVPTPTPPGVFSSSHIQSLTNGDKLPIVTVEACSTAKFYKDDETFNYAFLQNPNGGGIAAFGATALGWGYTGTGISQGLIGKMGLDTFRAYRYDDAITFGEMWTWALERYHRPTMKHALDWKTLEEWQPFGDPTLQIAPESEAPNKPDTPSGTTSGEVGKTYTYSSKATDPDGDKVYLKFDWGDGTDSGWVGTFNSGQIGSASHIWATEETFEIKVAAKDIHGKVSEWSNPLTITMPRSRTINSQFLQFLDELIEKYPNAFPILRHILGL